MFCSNCGTKALDGAEFCRQCGARLAADNRNENQQPEDISMSNASVRQDGMVGSMLTEETQSPSNDKGAKAKGRLSALADLGDKIEGYAKLVLVVLGILLLLFQNWLTVWNLPTKLFGLTIFVGIFAYAIGLILSGVGSPMGIRKIWKLVRGVFFLVVEIVTAIMVVDGIYVQIVKNGTLDNYPQMTVGEAFDGFIENPKWESGKSVDKMRFVNVKGSFMSDDKEAEIVVQFLVDEKTGRFQYNACEINGVPQDVFTSMLLFESVYEEAARSAGGDAGGDSNPVLDTMVIGETKSYGYIYGKVEVTLDSVAFVEKTSKRLGYDYPDEGNVFLRADITVRNIDTQSAGLVSAGIVYDSEYKFGGELLQGDCINIPPLSEPQKAVFRFEVPMEVMESDKPLALNLEGGVVSFDIRSPGDTLANNQATGSADSKQFSYASGNEAMVQKGIRRQAMDYVGEWGDTVSQRCMMSIAIGSQGTYLIEINWSSSASENTRWLFEGTFDSETGEMVYSGRRIEELSTDEGDIQTTVAYADGTGKLFLGDNGMLYWEDDKENAGKNCVFEKYQDVASADQTWEYVLPDSDKRYFSRDDLHRMGLSAAECRIARNEIYARHGRMFHDAELQAYFYQCSWYIPLYSPENFNEGMLNDCEKANRDLIVSYEKEMGYQ